MTEGKLVTGTVKWFKQDKGYGFINGDDGIEYFVHQTALKKDITLTEGDKVDFFPVDTDKGKQAKCVDKK